MNELVAYINKKAKKIELLNDSEILINSKKIQFNLLSLGDKTHLLKVGNNFFEVVAQKIDDEKYTISVDGVPFEIEIRTKLLCKHQNNLTLKPSKELSGIQSQGIISYLGYNTII